MFSGKSGFAHLNVRFFFIVHCPPPIEVLTPFVQTWHFLIGDIGDSGEFIVKIHGYRMVIIIMITITPFMIIIIIIHNHLITTIPFMIEFNPRDIPIISYYIPFIPSNRILVPWEKLGIGCEAELNQVR